MKKAAIDGGKAPDASGCTRGALRANGSWDPEALWNPAWTPEEIRASRYPRRRMAFFALLLSYRRGSDCTPAEMADRIAGEAATFRPGYDGEKNPSEMFRDGTLEGWARLVTFEGWAAARGQTSAEQMLIHEGRGTEGREWRGGRWAKADERPRSALTHQEGGDDPW